KPEWNCFPMSVYRYKCPSYNQALARLGSRIRVWSHVSLAGHTGTTKRGHRMKFAQDHLSSTPLVFSAHQTRINTLPVSVLYTEGYVFTEGYIFTEGYVFTGGYVFTDGYFSLRVRFRILLRSSLSDVSPGG